MDFELDAEQEGLQQAVGVLLGRHAGAARARSVLSGAGYDFELEAHLTDAGFLDLPATDGAGPLEATIVVEAIAAAHGTIAAGTRAIVLPALGIEAPHGPVALVDARSGGPTRFAPVASTLLVVGATGVAMCPADGRVQPVETLAGFPYGEVTTVGERTIDCGGGDDVTADGQTVDVDPEAVRSWWRLALACEITGVLDAAVALTTRYVSERHQFGRPLGAFQAVQHKLAECHVSVEATRWLVRWAAWHGAEPELTATAAAHAAAVAGSVVADLHQVSGAMGFTDEHDLALGTMRAFALRLELGGLRGHTLELAERRWGR